MFQRKYLNISNRCLFVSIYFLISFFRASLTPDYEEIIRTYSEHVHDYWCYNKFEQGWSYGDTYSDSTKVHPLLRAYPNLPRKVD